MKHKLRWSLILNNALLSVIILILLWIGGTSRTIHKQYVDTVKEGKEEIREFRGIWNTVCTQLFTSAQINLVEFNKRKKKRR